MNCQQCKYYSKPLVGKPVCSRISNFVIPKGKNVPFKVPEAFRICKGYFFEHSKDDLFNTFDDSLSDSTFPFE